jgi:hypothetical protein
MTMGLAAAAVAVAPAAATSASAAGVPADPAALVATAAGGPTAYDPIPDPAVNTPPNPSFYFPCGTYGALSPQCVTATVQAIDNARAREGVGPLHLPGNYTALPADQQLFVVTQAERADRGVAPLTGLNAYVGAAAQSGADRRTDPSYTPNAPGVTQWFAWAANWASDYGALGSDYDWMYNDGPGGSNIECTATNHSGCWGHRHNVLSVFPGQQTIMGAAVSGNATGTSPASFATLIVGVNGNPATWAPATAPAPYGAIGGLWSSIGGAASVLGAPVTNEYAVPGGRAEDFAFGRIYWSPATGAQEVHGAILGEYLATGGPAGPLGLPTSSENRTPDGIGRFNHFTGGWGASIYWTPNTGAHAVQGAIRGEWAATGWENGPLGYPTTDETGTPDGIGRFNHFAKAGSIYWTPTTGAHEVHGAIRAAWAAAGWERAPQGYPTSDEFGVAGGRQNIMQRGSLFWNASTNRVSPR